MNEYEQRAYLADIAEKLTKHVYDMLFRYCACILDVEEETDLSSLTIVEVIKKMRDVRATYKNDTNLFCFHEYLTRYPVSMCKRDVSPLLRLLIGFHYRLGVPTEQQKQNGAEKVSYDDLSEIFGRSKATISECVNATENDWNEIISRYNVELKLEEEARESLLEDRKKQLREQQKNEGTNSQSTNEQRSTSGGG